MKRGKMNRALSLLLAAIMVLAMLPFSAISTFAADSVYSDDLYWLPIGANGFDDDVLFAGDGGLAWWLADSRTSGYGYTDGVCYIKLMEDLTVKFDRTATDDETNGGYINLPVNGNKVLDLNGHTIKVTMDLGSSGCDYTGTLFVINGAKLTVVDSTGGGKIATNMYIAKTRTAEYYYFDMFKVTNGGELVLNAPDAEFECGRSKLQTYWKPRHCGMPTGEIRTARNQANGTVVTLESGSKLTVAGGTLYGRGFSYANSTGIYTRCNAIRAKSGTTVHIADAKVYGKGGANALNIDSDVDLTIESGIFDVSKVDNVTLVEYNGYYNYMTGSYGKVGISESVLEKLSYKNSAVQITKGGQDTTGDELDDEEISTDKTDDRITISLTDGGMTSDSRVSIKPVNGLYSFDPFNGSAKSTYKVDLNYYERYFSDTALELIDGNYRPRTAAIGGNAVEYYLSWSVTLHKTNGNLVATLYETTTPASQTSISGVDLVASYGYTNWANLDAQQYVLRCAVTEVWKGENSYNTTWRNDVAFWVSDSALATAISNMTDFTLDFNVKHVLDKYYLNTQTISCELNSNTLQKLNELKETFKSTYGDFDITVQYSIRSYIPNGEATKNYSLTTSISNTATIKSYNGAGLKVIEVTVNLPRWDSAGNVCGYDKITASKNFLLLPKMQKVTIADDGTETSEESGFHNIVGVNPKQYIKVNTGIEDWSTNPSDSGELTWQWYSTTEHDVDIETDLHNGGVYSEALVTADGNSYKLTLDGTYRLACTYTPHSGGKAEEFVSVPIDVSAWYRQDWYTSTLSGNSVIKPTATDLQSNLLTLTLGDGIWGTIESVALTMRSRPSEVAHSTMIYGTRKFSTATNTSYYTFNLYDFKSIQQAIADNCAGGEYTFRATIRGKDTSGTRYTKYSNDFTVTFEQSAVGYGLIANGEYLGRGYSTLEEAQNQVVPLFLNTNSFWVEFDVGYYPQSATYDPDFYGKSVYYSYSLVSGSQFITQNHYEEFIIYSPGVFILHVTVGAYFSDVATKDVYFKVCIPVTAIEFEVPDYQSMIGQKYTDIPLANVVLYAANGRSISGNDYLVYDGYEPRFVDGWSTDTSKVVAVNDYDEIYYYIHLNEKQCFPLEQVYDGKEYMVDLSAVTLTIKHNGTTTTKTAEMWGAYMNENKDYCDVKGYRSSTTYAGFRVEQKVHIKDEDAVYIDIVSINTTTPGVGDPINEGITIFDYNGKEWQQLGCTCKAADILTMANIKTSDGKDIIVTNKSCVSKATGNTAGLPYTDASGAKYEGQNAWMYSSFLNDTYDAGTYYHELNLYTNNNTAADGTKYYFAPNVKVILNGRILDYTDANYHVDSWSSYSYLAFSYFYDVGEVTTITDLDLTGVKPLQGAVPACTDDIAVSATAGSNALSDGTVEVSRIVWFVDANGNGLYDSGEELQSNYRYGAYNAATSNIWWDGTFLPGVAYSAYIELSTDNTAIRFATDADIDCDGYSVTSNGNRSFTVNFDADYVIRVISVSTSEGADAASPDGRDPLELANANPGYYIGTHRVHKHKNNATATAAINNFIDYSSGDLARSTLAGGKYWLVYTFSTTSSDYTFADDVKVLVNGNDYGETFATGRNEIVVEKAGIFVTAYYCFTVPASVLAGDVNGDGNVNSIDAALILKYSAGSINFTEAQLSAGDYNGDGNVNSIDAAMILKKIAGL